MSHGIIHIVRDGETIGSYPAWIAPRLVETWKILPSDEWFAEGMGGTLPVSELVAALKPERSVAVTNFPEPPESPAVRDVKVVGFAPTAGQVFLVTLGVALSLLVIAIVPWLLLFAGILSVASGHR